ncbi:GNAT family N-acetyltransferase [Nocardioides sp.]|uniref:GNAT family N-acetyltransferase n=1 Tax=Nocardioides sp. TaxID=35761 RepID=UPI00262C34E8|nr:GNAT family N-acetyltransferase [Nocardioides sp.]
MNDAAASAVEVRDNPAENRYEVFKDGQLAGFSTYTLSRDVIIFLHTETDPAYAGQGLGSALARGLLDDVRRRGLAVVPLCPFIKGWIDKHPDYATTVESSRPL